MPLIELPIRVGDHLNFDFDGETWEVPLGLAQQLVSNRRLIDAVKRECLPSITRAPKEQRQEL